jgi:hypothetical protein
MEPTHPDGESGYIRRVTHNRAFRALAAVLSVWLGICLAEPMQLHLCVMHGGLAIQSPAHGSHSHGSMAHDASHSTGDHEKSQQCSCLGDCTTGGTAAFVAPYFRIALPSVERDATLSVPTSSAVAASDFVLPFANGPPGISSLA